MTGGSPCGPVGNLETSGSLGSVTTPNQVFLEMRAGMECHGGPTDTSCSELAPEL